MHGSIFVFFKRFVENKYDHATWITLVEKAGTINSSPKMNEIYPDKDIIALVKAAADITGKSSSELLELFGEALVPDLLFMYNQYINPAWKTLDMLENTELVMHKAVRAQEGTSPPVLNVSRISSNELIIDYNSKRRMGSLAIGIIRGIAKYYHDENKIKITAKTRADEERVQIHVSYLNSSQ